MIEEHWQSVSSGRIDQTGTSLNAFDHRYHRWHHSWFDSFGNVLQMDGGLEGRNMKMLGYRLTPQGGSALERTVWVPLPSEAFISFGTIHWTAVERGSSASMRITSVMRPR